MHNFYRFCLILLVIGGVNWGLGGLFQFDLIGWMLGGSAALGARIVFVAIGIAALCAIPGLFGSEEEASCPADDGQDGGRNDGGAR